MIYSYGTFAFIDCHMVEIIVKEMEKAEYKNIKKNSKKYTKVLTWNIFISFFLLFCIFHIAYNEHEFLSVCRNLFF